jgi:hypothetical protein
MFSVLVKEGQTVFKKLSVLALCLLVLGVMLAPVHAAPPVSGAVFTTDSTCTGVNLNIYSSKDAVYLDGGPTHTGSAGLPDGYYYVQVTEPNGTVLGRSDGAVVHVTGGEFDFCYQLSAILFTASSGFADQGYDTTSNPGGEYKVWVSNEASFTNSSTKTDNFKVKESDVPSPTAKLNVLKFYDANANGVKDGNEQYLVDWKVNIHDSINIDRYTPVAIIVDPDDYVVSEYSPVEQNWIPTTATSFNVHLDADDEKTVIFGNVCLGAGGGLTLGFWSNKNGQALINPGDLLALRLLNLRKADGSNFDPNTNTDVKNWLLSANATNMAYMLSAQLAAMKLNVLHNKVSAGAIVYYPGLGFITIGALMTAADNSLAANPLTVAASAARTEQEKLKNALDQANNNLNFVQSSPCPYSFS